MTEQEHEERRHPDSVDTMGVPALRDYCKRVQLDYFEASAGLKAARDKLNRQNMEIALMRSKLRRTALKSGRRHKEIRRLNRTVAILYAAIRYGTKSTDKPRLVTVEINDG
jgi:hypothetical protein